MKTHNSVANKEGLSGAGVVVVKLLCQQIRTSITFIGEAKVHTTANELRSHHHDFTKCYFEVKLLVNQMQANLQRSERIYIDAIAACSLL